VGEDRREQIIVVVAVKEHPESELLEIAHAGGLAPFLPGLPEHRKQKSSQNSDNGYYYQQLDQREPWPSNVSHRVSFIACRQTRPERTLDGLIALL
jgi:hypothetical protein